jgi:hypothetical protein
VILPERRYDLAGHLLARAVDNAAAQGSTVEATLKAVAGDWGRSVADQARATAGPRPSRERLLACTCQALTENGYEAQRSGDTIVLRNCPFDALAREHTELVCGMNLAIMAAVTEQLQETALIARLKPAPDCCCVVLVPADIAVSKRQHEESIVDDVTARTRARVAETGVRVDAESILTARDAEATNDSSKLGGDIGGPI